MKIKRSDQSNNKKTALITGASSGIGCELSRIFAEEGFNLVLVARDKEKLENLADELKKSFGVSVKVISKDLSFPDSPEEIFDELKKESINIDILVNNAGFGLYGVFSEADLKKETEMIHVNIISLTHLTKLFLPGMIKQGYGKILNVGSIGSFVPGPLNSVYCASKAYVLSFSEAISGELQGTGVSVTVLCPGSTRTEFHKRAGMENIQGGKFGAMSARSVAETGYHALMKGEVVVIPGMNNKFMAFLIKFIPRSILVKIVKSIMKSKQAKPKIS